MPVARPRPALVRGTTRRAALVAGGAALGVVATGCGEAGAPAGVSTGGRVAAEGDEALLAAVRSELAGAVALVAGTRRRHRALRATLADLQATHTAQVGVLDPDGEAPTGSIPEVAAEAGTALDRLRDAEERLQRRLLTWAVAVDSGPLARVLAAAAAGTAQQLALLRETEPA